MSINKNFTGDCETPGEKNRSKGKGKGLARGSGKGPLGTPNLSTSMEILNKSKVPAAKKRLSISTKQPSPKKSTMKDPGTAKIKNPPVKKVNDVLAKALYAMIPEIRKEMIKDGIGKSSKVEKGWGSAALTGAKLLGRGAKKIGSEALKNPEATGRAVEQGIKGINTLRDKGTGAKRNTRQAPLLTPSPEPQPKAHAQPSGFVNPRGESISSTIHNMRKALSLKPSKVSKMKQAKKSIEAGIPNKSKVIKGKGGTLGGGVIGSVAGGAMGGVPGSLAGGALGAGVGNLAENKLSQSVNKGVRKAKVRKGKGGILGGGLAGTVAGGMVGGPAGAAIGGALGSGAGNAIENKTSKMMKKTNPLLQTARKPRATRSNFEVRKAKVKKGVRGDLPMPTRTLPENEYDPEYEYKLNDYRNRMAENHPVKKSIKKSRNVNKSYLNQENSDLTSAQMKTVRDSGEFHEETVSNLTKREEEMQRSELDMAKARASLNVEKAIFYLKGYEPMSDDMVKKSFHGQIPEQMKALENRPPNEWWVKSIQKSSTFSEDPIKFSYDLWYKAVAEPLKEDFPHKTGEENQISDGSRADVSVLTDPEDGKKAEYEESL